MNDHSVNQLEGKIQTDKAYVLVYAKDEGKDFTNIEIGDSTSKIDLNPDFREESEKEESEKESENDEPQAILVDTQEVIDSLPADEYDEHEYVGTLSTGGETPEVTAVDSTPVNETAAELFPTMPASSNTEEIKEVIAGLCVDAPSAEIRKILRLYSPDHSYKRQTSSFNNFSKKDIVQALVFLGEEQTNWNDYLKPACTKALIYRIQSLLPEECGICNEVYTVKKSDIHFLSCSVCRQEVHHKCYISLLSNDNGLIVNTPGFHYLCQSCEKDLIPGEEKRLKKQRQQANNKHDSKNCNETSCQEMKNFSNAKKINESVPCTTNELSHPKDSNPKLDDMKAKSSNSNSTNSSCEKSGHLCPTATKIQATSREGNKLLTECNKKLTGTENGTEKGGSKAPSKKICNQYKNNNCKFGMKGNGCQFLHPKRCTKLMKYGTKAEKGCNLGKKCTEFHPKMCSTSLARGVCYDNRCALCHVKDTRRKKIPAAEKKQWEQSKSPSSSESNEKIPSKKTSENNVNSDKQAAVQQSFLEQISLLKKEIQEAMDLKISSILSPMNLQQIPQKTRLLPETTNQSWQVPLQGPLQRPVPVSMISPQPFHPTNHQQPTAEIYHHQFPVMYPQYPQFWGPAQELCQAPVSQCPLPPRMC